MEINRLKDAATLLIPLFVIPIALAIGSLYLFPNVVYFNIPLHAILEVMNVLVSFCMVAMLLLLRKSLKQYIPQIIWLSCAYLVMGLLDLGHIFQDINNNSIWIRCVSTFLGGICFALVWAPSVKYEHWHKQILVIIAILVIAQLWLFMSVPDFAPLMIENNKWTLFPILINIVAAMCFIASTLYFVEAYLENYRVTSLGIAASCILYSASCFIYNISIIGDVPWWLFHITRNVASLVLFSIVTYIFTRLSNENVALEEENAKLKIDIEKALNEQDKKLEAKHAELLKRQKHDAVEQLASGIAHEFNALLDNISRRVYLIQDKYASDKFLLDKTSEILSCTRQGESKSNQILTYARENTIDFELINLEELIEEVKSILQMVEENKKYDYEFLNEETDITVYADHAKLLQLIMNLIQNAQDGLPHGGKIIIDSYSVQDVENSSKRWGVIKIIDEGEGLSEEEIEKIFEPFYTTRTPGKSSGLGLSVVHGLIKDFHGRIEVKSKKGLGAVFTVSLPKIESDTDLNNLSDPDIITPQEFLKDRSILIVDDDDNSRDSLKSFLLLYTQHIFIAKSAKEAKLILETNPHINFVIADYFLPDKTGIQFVKDIEDQFLFIKTILVLHYGQKINLQYLNAHPSVVVITKPYPWNELLIKLALLSGAIYENQEYLVSR